MRGLFESSVAEVPHYEQEHKYGDRRGFEDDFAGHNTIQYSTVGSANPMTYEFERAAGRNYPIETSVNQFGGTGIKMTSGQLQQQQISDNFINQGTARRSNCLQMKTSSESCTEVRVIGLSNVGLPYTFLYYFFFYTVSSRPKILQSRVLYLVSQRQSMLYLRVKQNWPTGQLHWIATVALE